MGPAGNFFPGGAGRVGTFSGPGPSRPMEPPHNAGGRCRETVEASVMPVAFVSATRFVGLELREETGRTLLSLHELRGGVDDFDDGTGAQGFRVAREVDEASGDS